VDDMKVHLNNPDSFATEFFQQNMLGRFSSINKTDVEILVFHRPVSEYFLYIMRNTIIQALSQLAAANRIFCSEADFQFALAWELQRLLPLTSIFLEKGVSVPSDTYYVDIVVESGGKIYYIELKYHTSTCNWHFRDTPIRLKNQGAQDLLRYDYLKDIYRLQKIKNNCEKEAFAGGFAIILTNDRLVYDAPVSFKNTLDCGFRIHDRRGTRVSKHPIPGLVSWNNKGRGSGHWTQRGERKLSFSVPPISTAWSQYLSFRDSIGESQDFRYLINTI